VDEVRDRAFETNTQFKNKDVYNATTPFFPSIEDQLPDPERDITRVPEVALATKLGPEAAHEKRTKTPTTSSCHGRRRNCP
jgi:hypothetical protein